LSRNPPCASNNPAEDFEANPTIEELIAQQHKAPIADPTVWLGDFWPNDESIENFLSALHEWRRHNSRTAQQSVVVVDADVVSFLFKNHSLAQQYLPEPAGCVPILSFMTLAELDRWMLQSRCGPERQSRLREYLETVAVFPYNRKLCAIGRKSRSHVRATGSQTMALTLGLPQLHDTQVRHYSLITAPTISVSQD
jgi:hypothetical protein